MNEKSDNASGAGMETVAWADHLDVEEDQPSFYCCNDTHMQAGLRFSVPLVRRTDASRLLAEKEGELQRLRQANAALLDQMHHFANADQRLWDEGQRDAEAFKSWVRSRAAHLLAKFNTKEA